MNVHAGRGQEEETQLTAKSCETGRTNHLCVATRTMQTMFAVERRDRAACIAQSSNHRTYQALTNFLKAMLVFWPTMAFKKFVKVVRHLIGLISFLKAMVGQKTSGQADQRQVQNKSTSLG